MTASGSAESALLHRNRFCILFVSARLSHPAEPRIKQAKRGHAFIRQQQQL